MSARRRVQIGAVNPARQSVLRRSTPTRRPGRPRLWGGARRERKRKRVGGRGSSVGNERSLAVKFLRAIPAELAAGAGVGGVFQNRRSSYALSALLRVVPPHPDPLPRGEGDPVLHVSATR